MWIFLLALWSPAGVTRSWLSQTAQQLPRRQPTWNPPGPQVQFIRMGPHCWCQHRNLKQKTHFYSDLSHSTIDAEFSSQMDSDFTQFLFQVLGAGNIPTQYISLNTAVTIPQRILDIFCFFLFKLDFAKQICNLKTVFVLLSFTNCHQIKRYSYINLHKNHTICLVHQKMK